MNKCTKKWVSCDPCSVFLVSAHFSLVSKHDTSGNRVHIGLAVTKVHKEQTQEVTTLSFINNGRKKMVLISIIRKISILDLTKILRLIFTAFDLRLHYNVPANEVSA